ncbi:hypothetical protein WJX84_004217 [Apatococcus fuscideae]|uniref:SAP domain-containing protein n=1 Tax=Apatococcus fuscideae TaxID=2026836 RepID=A0AAW1SJD0_9CHLO
MSFLDLPEDCLNHIGKFLVEPDLLHPVCVRAREAAELATASKAFRSFTEQNVFSALATMHCPPALPSWPYPSLGSWDTAEHVIPKLTIPKLKPILRATGCKVSGKKADLVAQDEDEDAYMMDAQAMHLGGFMAAAFANPLFFPAFGPFS